MWEKILESTIPAAVLGIFATIISVILSNKISEEREKSEKKYNFYNEIYKKLVKEYDYCGNSNLNNESGDVSNMFTNALTEVFKMAVDTLKRIQTSFYNTKFIYTVEEVFILEAQIKEVEQIHKKLYFTALNNSIKDKPGYEKIVVNDEIEMYDDNDYQKYMRIFIDEVNKLQSSYLSNIENKLRKMLN